LNMRRQLLTPLSVIAETIPGIETGDWTLRNRSDAAANALADRHYSRRKANRFAGQVGGPGRIIVLVTPCERALWITRWNTSRGNADGLDAWRCELFRNEGAGLSSDLIQSAMKVTEDLWVDRPRDGWVTWVDRSKIRSDHPGYCFKRAGWWVDRGWTHSRLLRLRAAVARYREASDGE
jgi:hypothetical protein